MKVNTSPSSAKVKNELCCTCIPSLPWRGQGKLYLHLLPLRNGYGCCKYPDRCLRGTRADKHTGGTPFT